MRDEAAGSHAGDTSGGASGTGSGGGDFIVPLPDAPNLPPSFGAPPEVPAQNAPDRPDLTAAPAQVDDQPGGPLTTSNASSLLAGHGAHHIRPRPRHA